MMWCPKGYHSWNVVLNHLIETSQEVLSLVAQGGEPPSTPNPSYQLEHTPTHYRRSQGFSSSYEDAEMNVAITACFLLAHFLEDYPPFLAGLNGQLITVDSVFLEHRDQLHLCPYGWPVKSQSEFSRFFEYVENGDFEPMAIFDRFAFVDATTGEFRLKNGSEQFLNGYTPFFEQDATRLIDLAKQLTGFVICWEDLPDESEFRNFLSYLEVDETFTRALDHRFGPATEAKKPEVTTPKRSVGRPSKQAIARSAYWAHFPDGHESAGKTWKEAHLAIESDSEVRVDITTLKRAVRNTGQKGQ